MSTPKTLLEMSGADMRPPPLSGATLVIIDAQNEYLDGKLALPGVEAGDRCAGAAAGEGARGRGAGGARPAQGPRRAGCSISRRAAAPSSMR